MTSSLACTSSGVPRAIILPKSITTMLITQPHDDFHVVFDEQDGQIEFLLDLLDELHQICGLVGVHSGCRFVQQQQLGLQRQRTADFQPPLVAYGRFLESSLALSASPTSLQL
jgi:hypothetical protein